MATINRGYPELPANVNPDVPHYVNLALRSVDSDVEGVEARAASALARTEREHDTALSGVENRVGGRVDGLAGRVDGLGTRVGGLEVLGGVRPGSPTDATTAQHIAQADSLTRLALAGVFDAGYETRLYVSAGGNDARSGLVPGAAKKTIAAALAALGDTAGEVVLLPKAGPIKITAPVRLEGNRHRIVGGHGAIIDATGITSGHVFFIGSDATSPYYQVQVPMEGFTLRGSGKTGGVTALYMDEPGVGASHFAFKDLNIYNFGTGIALRDNAYVLSFLHVDVWNCDTGVSALGGEVDNGGERMCFSHCTIYNNNVGVYGGHGGLFFVDCSLDYNETMVNTVQSRVFLYSCHVEIYSTRTKTLFLTSGQAGAIRMFGGVITLNGPSQGGGMPYVIENNSSYETGSRFVGVSFNNLLTTTGYFAGGTGYTAADDDLTYGGTSLNYEIFSENGNLLSDGGFEESALGDYWFISEDSAPVTSASLTGKNISAAVSKDYSRSGTQSLKLTKTGGKGSNASVTVAVPIPRGAKPRFRFHYKKPGAGTGSVYVNATFAQLRTNPDGSTHIARKTARTPSNDIELPVAAVDWTKNIPIKPVKRAPMWATHYLLELRLFAFTGGGESLYIDDLEISL